MRSRDTPAWMSVRAWSERKPMTRRMMGAESGRVKRRSCEVGTYASSRRALRRIMAARWSLGSGVASAGAGVASGAAASEAGAACSTTSCSAADSDAGSGSPNGSEGCTTPPGSLASALGSPSNLPRRRRAGFSASRAASAAASRAFSATNAAAEVSSCTVACVRAGAATSPACITMTPQVLVLTNSTILGSVKPVTSLTIEAPQRTAALATAT